MSSTTPAREGAKRAAIVAAARRHFVENGYSAANLDRIAAGAGVSKVTIYSHFGSKESLFLEVMDDVIERLTARDRIDPDIAAADLPAYLSATARALIATVADPEVVGMRRVLIAEQPRHPQLAARWRVETVLASTQELAGALRTADERLAPTAATRLAGQFLWMVIGDPLDAALMTGSAATDAAERADAAVPAVLILFAAAVADAGD